MVGVVGALAVAKRLAFRRFRRFGHGCDTLTGCRGGGRRFGGMRIGRSGWLRRLFDVLDTTPGQEREIRSAIAVLRATAFGARDGLEASRAAAARSVRGEVFDEAAVAEATDKFAATTTPVRQAIEEALRRIQAVLDPEQRVRLSDLLAKGRRAFGPGGEGPYRGAASGAS
jgi:Spy/CpxP family protein refolding chaperone